MSTKMNRGCKCAKEFTGETCTYPHCIAGVSGKLAKVRKAREGVDHPSHYTSHPSGIECIQITRHMNFNLGNALKYIWRCDLKTDDVQDLEKAIFYLKDEIKLRRNRLPDTEYTIATNKDVLEKQMELGRRKQVEQSEVNGPTEI